MSFVNELIKTGGGINKNKGNFSDKYDSVLQAKILNKKINNKLRQYSNLQAEYNTLIDTKLSNRTKPSGGWKQIPGGLKQISTSGNNAWIWGVNSGDAIWRCKKPCDYTSSNKKWWSPGGRLKQISVGDDEVWGVNSNNNIYKINPEGKNGWKYVRGSLKQVINSGKGWVWGINGGGDVFRCKKPCNGSWILDTKAPQEETVFSSESAGACRNSNGGWGFRSYMPWFNGRGGSPESCKEFCDNDPVCTAVEIWNGGSNCWYYNDYTGLKGAGQSNATCSVKANPTVGSTGKQWKLVFRQSNNSWPWNNKNNEGNFNSNDENAGQYSILDRLEQYRGLDGKLTFMLFWPEQKNLVPQIWKQTTNPYSTRNNRNGTVSGYERIYTPYTGNRWGGLRWNGGSAMMSGSTNGWWWYAVGSHAPWAGGNYIPGPNGNKVTRVELYVLEKFTTKIHIGNSRSNTKTVTLPEKDMIVNPIAINVQNPRWGDKFSTQVSGNKLKVRRLDARAGWGQNLYLQAKSNDRLSTSGNVLPLFQMLAADDTHVYALDNTGKDNSGKLWRKNVDGTGEWSRWYPNSANKNWDYIDVNVSGKNKIYVIGLGNKIYYTYKDRASPWKVVSSDTTYKNVSGDPTSGNMYAIGSDGSWGGSIWRHAPLSGGGYWLDKEKTNYMYGMVSNPGDSTDDWKYLGKPGNLQKCKIKAAESDTNFSSVVYTTNPTGAFKDTCYGNVAGGANNPQYQKGITTSIAPDGGSELGGAEGRAMLDKLISLQDEINDLVKEQTDGTIGLQKSNGIIGHEKIVVNAEMVKILDKLRKDRIEINKLVNEPDNTADEEDASYNQIYNYSIYVLWILLVIITIAITIKLYGTESSSISTITYLFVSIWILVLVRFYYSQAKDYLGTGIEYVTSFIAGV